VAPEDGYLLLLHLGAIFICMLEKRNLIGSYLLMFIWASLVLGSPGWCMIANCTWTFYSSL